MKTLWALTLGTLFSLSFTMQGVAAPQGAREKTQGRDRVCVYKDVRYQGWEQCYNVGDEVADLGNHNNAISSVRVFGRASVTVYEDTGFKGRSADFAADVPDLGLRSLNGSRTWSDHIQSLRVISDSPRVVVAPPIREGDRPDRHERPERNDGVCVYDRPDYEGREQCWSAGQDLGDLARAGDWSDRIRSIRVFGRTAVVLYRDIRFRGESIMIDRDVPNLEQLPARAFRNWDRQASSIQIERERRDDRRNERRFR